MTRRAGVIGWPVDHSLSPVIHNAAFAATGLDWRYEAIPVPPDGLADALRRLVDEGFDGASVTMPHKGGAAERMDSLSEDARRLAAVNTILVADGLHGHNTDAPGFERFLREDLAFDGSGRRALVLGAGGAARACVLALGRMGVGEIVVAARDVSRALRCADLAGGTAHFEAIGWDAAAAARPHLVVNATPLGGAGEPLPLPDLAGVELAVDLLYRPTVTTLLREAHGAGIAASGGLGLLLHQGALAFEIWTGQPAPIDVMSAAAVAALADAPA